ncbi:MAG: CaiB/BaiF CoA transferase family protein [bacterium]
MQPFSNIRVIDLTHVIAGPFCTYQLAVLGADVIKIEPPGAPDMVRQEGHDPDRASQGMGTIFMTQNANKRSIAVDLKTSEGREIVLKLLQDADVMVENHRPGAMQKLGLGYQEVKAIRPDIIYCSLSGYGQEGPIAERTAYDNVIQAMSGLMASTGTPDSGPVKVGPPVLDYGTGVQAAFAISAALYHRSITGQGQRIDIAMLDAAIMLSSTSATLFHESKNPPDRIGNSSAGNAGYGCFNTANGLIMIGAYTGEQLYNAWRVMGDVAHGAHLRHFPAYKMKQFLESDRPRIALIMMTDDANSWELKFNQAKVPAARVRCIDETLNLPQLVAREVMQTVNTDKGQVSLPTAAFKFEHGGPKLENPPPHHGEHTIEVLKQAGYEKEKIEEILQSGVAKAL